MLHTILKTDKGDFSSLIIRVVLAIVIFPHGLQKLFGLFGGFGFGGTMLYFTDTVGLPWIVGFLVILAETAGPLILLAGFLSRFAAVSLLLVMSGAITVHLENGFFMNWFGNQDGEGIEFFILAIAMSLHVIMRGAGKWSLDERLARSLEEKSQSALNNQLETYI